MKILGIDPGATCGVAMNWDGVWSVGSHKYGQAFLDRLREQACDIAVVENWTPQPWRDHGLVGAKEQSDRIYEITAALARAGIPCVVQPSEAMGAITHDEMRLLLQQAGVTKSNRHERDAARHVHVWLSNERRRGRLVNTRTH